MNNKIRLTFLILVLLIFVVSLLIFNSFQAPLDPKIDKISELKITKISGNGKIYWDKNPFPMEESGYSSAKEVNIKQMQYPEPIYFKADDRSAFELYCVGLSITVLPRSYFYYKPNSNEFYFYTGEFYWNKQVQNKKSNVSVYIREPQNTLTLSSSGRIKIQENLIQIWNYSKHSATSESRNLLFNCGEREETFTLNPSQLLILEKDGPYKLIDVLPLPESIDPEEKVIILKNPEDSVVRFNWKSVAGAKQYLFRLYSSNLKENLLLEKSTQLSWINFDLLQFEEREFYWQVFPINTDDKDQNQTEGIPSVLGHIQMVGSLMSKKDVQKPPQLTIKSLTVNGNLVIIKGNADPNAQLYINDDLVKVDMDGEFIHYLSFKNIGPKRIFFRLVSPLGVETTEERFVTIFAD